MTSFRTTRPLHQKFSCEMCDLNEDEFLYVHRGSGLFTLGEKQYEVREGAVAFIPKGVWHGTQNTGSENIEVRFGYSPAGFEGCFGDSLKVPEKEQKMCCSVSWKGAFADNRYHVKWLNTLFK